MLPRDLFWQIFHLAEPCPFTLDPPETYDSLKPIYPYISDTINAFSYCYPLSTFLQDLTYARDELARYKTNFSVEISGKEAEIETLRLEVTSLKVRFFIY